MGERSPAQAAGPGPALAAAAIPEATARLRKALQTLRILTLLTTASIRVYHEPGIFGRRDAGHAVSSEKPFFCRSVLMAGCGAGFPMPFCFLSSCGIEILRHNM